MLPILTPSHWLTLHALVTVAALLAYTLASHALPQRRHPSAAIGWVLFIFLLPYAALPLYLMLGTRKLRLAGRAPTPTRAVLTEDDKRSWVAEVTAALAQPEPAAYRHLAIHADGPDALRSLLEVIDGARHTLDVSTFILGGDRTAGIISARLAARARAGVHVRLLLDGVGRLMGGRADLSPLTQAGARVEFFVPSLRAPLKGRLNLRNHRKLVVADAGHADERLWCGGRNLAAEYFEGAHGRSEWHDLSFDLQGPLVRQAAELFQHDWVFATGEDGGVLAVASPAAVEGEPAAQMIASGPDQADDTVHDLLISAAFHARRRIALVSPYVVPDDALQLALCMAARRGVQVDLLLPARSNHRLADFARHRSLRALAAAGVRIWLAPQMLHAKAAIVDEALALAGSANLDNRSLLLNYEMMVAFHETRDVERFAAWFDLERSTARRYVAEGPSLSRDIAEGLMLWVCFQI